MKIYLATTIFCECDKPMEHVAGKYVRCVNDKCSHLGEKYEKPTLELQPYVEATDEPQS